MSKIKREHWEAIENGELDLTEENENVV